MNDRMKIMNAQTVQKYDQLRDKFFTLEGEIRSFIASYIDNNFGVLDIKFFTQMHEDFMYGFCKKTDDEFKKTFIYKDANDDADRRIKESNESLSRSYDKPKS